MFEVYGYNGENDDVGFLVALCSKFSDACAIADGEASHSRGIGRVYEKVDKKLTCVYTAMYNEKM